MTRPHTHIKICGLTRLADARHAWQCGTDLLGFIFVAGSPRCVTAPHVAEIIATLRQEGCACDMVGVFAGQPVEIVRQTVDACALDHAQLHGGESPAYVRALGRSTVIAKRVAGAVPWDELADYAAWAYLLDSYDPQQLGGSGQRWNWNLVDQGTLCERRVLVAGGLSPDNVGDAVRQLAPWGVDVSSGVEASPGIKDMHKVRTFIDHVRKVETS